MTTLMMNNKQQIAQQLMKELGLNQETAEKAVSIVQRLSSSSNPTHITATTTATCSSASSSSCSPSPAVPKNHQTKKEENPAARDRVTNRQKRKRGTSGLNDSSDVEDETEEEEEEEQVQQKPTTQRQSFSVVAAAVTTKKKTTSTSTTSCCTTTRMPVTKSGKQQFHRELCQLLKENEGPLSVQDVADHFGWNPAVSSLEVGGGNYKINPSLSDYAICQTNYILALPSEDHWEQLNRKMRKSSKIQLIEGQDEERNWKTYRFLTTQDYNDLIATIYDAEEGLFPLIESVERDYRKIYLSAWITNRNGRYWLDEKPAFRTRACKILSSSSQPEEESKKQHQSSSRGSQSRAAKLTKEQLAKIGEIESETEADSDDEVDSVPSSSNKTSSTVNTLSSTNTVPLIPNIPDDEEFEKVEAEEKVPRAPPVPQFGGKSGNPALFYKYHQRSETGSILAANGGAKKNSQDKKRVTFDLEGKIPSSTAQSHTKSKQHDDGEEEIPAWVTAPILFADC